MLDELCQDYHYERNAIKLLRGKLPSPSGAQEARTGPEVWSHRTDCGHDLGEPEDITGAILFLTSDDAAFITGQAIVVDCRREIIAFGIQSMSNA